MQIKDSSFLVTGAASGLGSATASKLIEHGANVVLADINEAAAAVLASRLGLKARFIKTNVTLAEDARAAVQLAQTAFGALQGVVNCAGIAPSERIVQRDGPHSLETFVTTVNINLNGTFNMIRVAAAAMANAPAGPDGDRGVIINTASIAAFDGQIGQAAYAASKAGVVGMTLPLARDLARHAIRVVTIAPGVFETPMIAALPDETAKGLGAAVPFPARLGKPEEFAALVVHICENTMLNGEVIRLDGALRMGPR